MSCYKMGESLPSDPCGPCLVFLITSEGSIMNADGIKFYRPHGGRQMFLPIELGLNGWTNFASSMSPLSALEQRFIETKGATC